MDTASSITSSTHTSTTHSSGITDGDTDGAGDLGAPGTDPSGDGTHHTIGTTGTDQDGAAPSITQEATISHHEEETTQDYVNA